MLSRTGEQVEFSAARFRVLTALLLLLLLKKKKKQKKKMVMMIQVFWDKTSCKLANSCRRFGAACCIVA